MSPANRREPRLRAQVPVTITQGKKTLTATTEDVSYHGIYVAIEERPGLRQLIRIEVQLRGTETFQTHATVVRHGDDYGTNGIGLEFFGRTESAVWDQFVQEVQRNPPQIVEQRPPPRPPPAPPPLGPSGGMPPLGAGPMTPSGGMPPFGGPPAGAADSPRTPSRMPPPLPARGPQPNTPPYGSLPAGGSGAPAGYPAPPPEAQITVQPSAPPGPPMMPQMPQMPQMPPAPPMPPRMPAPPAPPQMPAPPPPPREAEAAAPPAASPGGGERRKYQRFPFPADIRVRTGRSMHATHGLDVSLGGVSVCGADLALSIGEQVILNLAQPGTNFTFRLDAVVRRTLPSPHPGTFAFGFEFLPLDPTRFALLVEFLETAASALGARSGA